jgi:hypothetical protein
VDKPLITIPHIEWGKTSKVHCPTPRFAYVHFQG